MHRNEHTYILYVNNIFIPIYVNTNLIHRNSVNVYYMSINIESPLIG